MRGTFQDLLDWVAAEWDPADCRQFLAALEWALLHTASGRDCAQTGQNKEQAWYHEEAALALAGALNLLERHLTDAGVYQEVRRQLYFALGVRLSVSTLEELWEPAQGDWWDPLGHVPGSTPIAMRLQAIERARAKVTAGAREHRQTIV